ncbi:MAG TPA: hypothetical protein VMI55_05930 [Thermoplasmata archaeon]|nr:hypothetical protein [Thermoplasmata archaeon]
MRGARGSPADEPTLIAQAGPIAKALNSVFAEAGEAPTMGSKVQRLKLQKAVYLLKRLGYPSARRWSFGTYLNGPYSPELAKAYYALGDSGIRQAGGASDIPAATLRTVADAIRKGPDFMEALATLLDGASQYPNLPAALAWARDLKPQIPGSTWTEVRGFLTSHTDLIPRT